MRAASPALVFLGRAGYAAKGIVFVVIGALAAGVCVGKGGKTTDSRGALHEIGDGPMGTIALVAIGVGLLGYMAWRLVAAATDAETQGDEPASLALRAAQAGRGIVYGMLDVQALRGIDGDSGSQDGAARHWTARLLDMPLGPTLVVCTGIGVLGYAAYQLYRAFSDRAKRHLDLAQAGPTVATWIVRLGRFGIAARAVERSEPLSSRASVASRGICTCRFSQRAQRAQSTTSVSFAAPGVSRGARGGCAESTHYRLGPRSARSSAQGSIRRTIKAFWIVDGEDR